MKAFTNVHDYVAWFSQKWLEKCSIAKHQPYQSKPAMVEMVDSRY